MHSRCDFLSVLILFLLLLLLPLFPSNPCNFSSLSRSSISKLIRLFNSSNDTTGIPLLTAILCIVLSNVNNIAPKFPARFNILCILSTTLIITASLFAIPNSANFVAFWIVVKLFSPNSEPNKSHTPVCVPRANKPFLPANCCTRHKSPLLLFIGAFFICSNSNTVVCGINNIARSFAGISLCIPNSFFSALRNNAWNVK